MSGTSRIGGYGGYSGFSGQGGRSASLVRFCRGRKQGDVVSGVFVRKETDILGWALLEGEELLAHLPEKWGTEGEGPSPGDRVFFHIESLVPDVVLRMLPVDDPLARLSVILPSVPLAQEAVLYVAARDRLDALLSASPQWKAQASSSTNPDALKETFINCVADDEAMLDSFAESLARSRSICRTARSAGLLFFRNMPWLGPDLGQVEVSLWQNGKTPIIAGARLDSGETLLLHGSMQGASFRYRVDVAGQGMLSGKFSAEHTDVVEYMNSMSGRGIHGGQPLDLVGRILALAADSGSMTVGRFSRKL